MLFYSHGGGFLVGASWIYDFRSLVSRSVDVGKPFVAVVVNYRMGPLGTLNPSILNDKDWNAGLLDQFEALRWVKEHIGAFGGDASKVTISKAIAP